ncbi:MAG: glycosyltransferase family 4 protein [Lachnospiraceae bacterium]|nr:glycosyltransferase family 4 protein [Lachnospiraceae bacterium]
MKILFVATEYPEKGRPTTGFPNYLYRISLALVRMGHTPIILGAGKKADHRMEQGIDIWMIKTERKNYNSEVFNYAVNGLRKSYLLNKKAKKIIKSYSVDVVQFTSLEGSAIFYRGKIPAVLRLSSYAKTYFSSFQTFQPTTVKVLSAMERWSAHRCNIVYAPCRITAEAFGKDCNRKVKVIETPFLNDVLEEEYDNTYVEKYLKNKKYILFFGSLYAEKGILVIAEILRDFFQNNPQYYFVFVGDICQIDGENAANMLMRSAEKYKDRVIIWKALPHKQLYPIIKNADFVVLPSLMDNFPNACIEAMYFERVVIGTNGASFEQLITHEKTGLLCEIGDAEDLLEKMQMAADMSDIQKVQMGRYAKIRVDKLKPELVVKKLLNLYEYVIENNKKAARSIIKE